MERLDLAAKFEENARQRRLRLNAHEDGALHLITSVQMTFYILEDLGEPVTPYTLSSDVNLAKNVELGTCRDIVISRTLDPSQPLRSSWVTSGCISRLREEIRLVTESIVRKTTILKNLESCLREEEDRTWQILNERSMKVQRTGLSLQTILDNGSLTDDLLRHTARCSKDPLLCEQIEECICYLVRQVLGKQDMFGNVLEETRGYHLTPRSSGLTDMTTRSMPSLTISAEDPTTPFFSECLTSIHSTCQSREASPHGIQDSSGSRATRSPTAGIRTTTWNHLEDDFMLW